MPRQRMQNMKLLQIDVPETLLKAFDEAVKKVGIYSSRTEAIRALMQKFIENSR